MVVLCCLAWSLGCRSRVREGAQLSFSCQCRFLAFPGVTEPHGRVCVVGPSEITLRFMCSAFTAIAVLLVSVQ